MKSQLLFKPIRNNILKVTVAFSAAVHLIGIALFPSWGTVPDLKSEKVIKISTFVEKPVNKKPPEPEKKNEPEPIIPKNRNKTPMVKSAKAVTPSPAEEKIPVPIHHSKQNFQPAKAIQQSASIPPSVASFQKMAEIKFPSAIPPSPRLKQTETPMVASSNVPKEHKAIESFLNIAQINTRSPIGQVTRTSETPSPHPTVKGKHFSPVTFIDRPRTQKAISSNSQGNLARVKAASVEIFSPSNLKSNFPIPSPRAKIKVATGNRKLKTNPLIRAQNVSPVNQRASAVPTGRKSFTSRMVSAPTAEIQVRSPRGGDSALWISSPQAIHVARSYSAYSTGTTSLLQMASIPTGFSEEFISEDGETNGNIFSGKNNSAGGTIGLSTNQKGKIKKAFSSQVWTKIAQSKYYPRTARKRGFEGEPVVSFTLGNTGNLIEVSINKPSPYKLLDEAALDAVKLAGPFPPIPEPLKLKTIRFKLPISFILEEP